MENLEETKKVTTGPKPGGLTDAEVDEIFKVPPKTLWLTARVKMRLVGFGLLVISLALMILWKKAAFPEFFRYISLGIFGLGILVYLTARVQDFLASRKTKKP